MTSVSWRAVGLGFVSGLTVFGCVLFAAVSFGLRRPSDPAGGGQQFISWFAQEKFGGR